ncbi:uncharacterized protein LOC144411713 [Styela clava]
MHLQAYLIMPRMNNKIDITKPWFQEMLMERSAFSTYTTNFSNRFAECNENDVCVVDDKHRHCMLCPSVVDTHGHQKRHYTFIHRLSAVTTQDGILCLKCKLTHDDSEKYKKPHYHCPICGKTSNDRIRFKHHLATHPKRQKAKENEMNPNSLNSDPQVVCLMCCKVIDRCSSLDHFSSAHHFNSEKSRDLIKDSTLDKDAHSSSIQINSIQSETDNLCNTTSDSTILNEESGPKNGDRSEIGNEPWFQLVEVHSNISVSDISTNEFLIRFRNCTDNSCDRYKKHLHCLLCKNIKVYSPSHQHRHFNEIHRVRAIITDDNIICLRCKLDHGTRKQSRPHYHCPICKKRIFHDHALKRHIVNHKEFPSSFCGGDLSGSLPLTPAKEILPGNVTTDLMICEQSSIDKTSPNHGEEPPINEISKEESLLSEIDPSLHVENTVSEFARNKSGETNEHITIKEEVVDSNEAFSNSASDRKKQNELVTDTETSIVVYNERSAENANSIGESAQMEIDHGMSVVTYANDSVIPGLDFIKPISGYTCTLCNSFYPDYPSSVRHCLLKSHKIRTSNAQQSSSVATVIDVTKNL